VPGYEFDVFISYTRSGNPYDWMRNNFLPRLKACLADQFANEPKVFIDEEMDRGANWPHRLENALNRSKIMVAVFSPQFFRSPWCRAEWDTMVARERLFGLNTAEQPQGLIYPVLFSDSENFPDFARRRSWRDFTDFNQPDLVFQQTIKWPDFHTEVEKVAIDLDKLLPRVPDWQPGWPAHRPEGLPYRTATPLPRFS